MILENQGSSHLLPGAQASKKAKNVWIYYKLSSNKDRWLETKFQKWEQRRVKKVNKEHTVWKTKTNYGCFTFLLYIIDNFLPLAILCYCYSLLHFLVFTRHTWWCGWRAEISSFYWRLIPLSLLLFHTRWLIFLLMILTFLLWVSCCLL